MSARAYRILFASLSVALAAVVILLFVLNTEGTEAELPEPLVAVHPPPNDMVLQQTFVEVRLPLGYEIELTVDGVRIPPDEIGGPDELGVFRWQPRPGGVIEVWGPGDHLVEVVWDRVIGGPPDPGEFRWSFRVV